MRENETYDGELVMQSVATVAASTAGQVDQGSGLADRILDLGGAAVFEADLIVDATAVEIASGDELYAIAVQGSSKSDFGSDYEDLAILQLGAKEVLGGDKDSTPGRYVLPFRNERNGAVYRYLRLYATVSGTVAMGLSFSARFGRD